MLYLQTSVKSKSDSIGINRFGFDVPTLNKTGIKRENRNTSEIGSDFDYRRIRALYLKRASSLPLTTQNWVFDNF